VKFPVEARPVSGHPIPRTAQHNIRLVVAGNDEPETPLEELTEVLEDSHSGLGPWKPFK
jgi:hypothetical protein